MDYFLYLSFFALLSALNLMISILIRFLDFANARSEEKLRMIKAGLVLTLMAPFILIVFQTVQLNQWNPPVIVRAVGWINSYPVHAAIARRIPAWMDWTFYIFCAYMTGFIAMLFRIYSSYLSAKKQLSTSSLSFVQGRAVFLNKHIRSPLSFGIPSAKIYFPLHAEQEWTAREIQLGLTHEIIHIEHNDSLWKLLSLIVQSLLFFAPWSYFLHRRFEIEMEIICDSRTCLRTGATISEYGGLLLRMVSGAPENPVFSNLTNSTLKRRFIAMKSKSIKRPFLTATLGSVLLLGCGIVTAMTSGMTEKKCTFDVTSKIYFDGNLVSSPRIVALENQKASIFMSNKDGTDSLRMEFSAKDITAAGIKDAIAMSFDVKYRDGEQQMHSRPKFVLAPGQEGNISLSSSTGHVFEMRVIAKRD